MNKTKFKVGDRVRAVKTDDGNLCLVGKTGTVKVVDAEYVGVEFDEHIKGHSLDGGLCKYGYGWNCYADTLVPICEKIVITTDGKTTTARLYDGKKLVKSSKATRHPDDEFDFERGAGIAISRLLEWEFVPAEKEQYFTGRVVCVKNKDLESYFTVGKIYDVVDGLLKADVKDRQLDNIRNIDYLNSIFSGNRLEFIEIIELEV